MNAPVDPIKRALHEALQALEARWPRHFDADSRRDHEAIKAVNAALEAIAAGKCVSEATEGEGHVVVQEADEVIVRPDSATREVTLSIRSHPVTASAGLHAVSLVFPAALACRIGALLLASGETLMDATPSEGGAA